MVFDKNAQRLKELRKKLVCETDSIKQHRLRKRISATEKRGSELWVRFTDVMGKLQNEKVPPEYRGMRGAGKFEALRVGSVESGHFSPKAAREARVDAICDHYLNGKMLGKPGYAASCTLVKVIKKYLPSFRLNDLSQQPEILNRHFAYFPEPEWSPKYLWNYRACLRAAIQFWIDTKEMFMYNPVDRIKVDKKINVQEYVPTVVDFEKVYMTTFTIGLSDEIRTMLIAVFESGLRINEVLGWLIEEMDLSPPRFDEEGNPIFLPYFTTEILKQGKTVKKRIPMTKRLWETMKPQIGDRKNGFAFSIRTPPYRMLRWLYCNQCGHREFDKGKVERTGKRFHAGDYCSKCKTGLLETRVINQEAGVPYARPFHDYRKSVKYLNKIIKRLPKELTKEFQGHATDSMDEYYLHLQTNDLYAVVADTWITKKPE